MEENEAVGRRKYYADYEDKEEEDKDENIILIMRTRRKRIKTKI